MEMTYDGALVMPNNCVMLSDDEMTYLDGGVVAKRVMKVGDAVKELADNAAFYGALAIGSGVVGVFTSVTGIGLASFVAAGGAGVIAAATYGAWKQARTIKNNTYYNNRVRIIEELTAYPLGYTCEVIDI